MRIINKGRFLSLSKSKNINCRNCIFLDDLRIGLRLCPNIRLAPKEIQDINYPDKDEWKKINLKKQKLQVNSFYIAKTKERLSLPNNVFGLIFTRSIYARVGLDVVQSSSYVAPGFGWSNPLPIILELSPKVTLQLDYKNPLAGLMLFELDNPLTHDYRDFEGMFPLKNL